MLWPVINEHGRQRGNWHVPVSPSSGEVDFSSAHYEGAADGSRIVLQRGEKHGKVLEAADVTQALQLMKDNPESPVVLTADHSERPDSRGTPGPRWVRRKKSRSLLRLKSRVARRTTEKASARPRWQRRWKSCRKRRHLITATTTCRRSVTTAQ